MKAKQKLYEKKNTDSDKTLNVISRRNIARPQQKGQSATKKERNK